MNIVVLYWILFFVGLICLRMTISYIVDYCIFNGRSGYEEEYIGEAGDDLNHEQIIFVDNLDYNENNIVIAGEE